MAEKNDAEHPSLGKGFLILDTIQFMTQETQELLKKALALPEKERADLAGSLIESLDQTVDENAEATWQKENSFADSKKFDPAR